MEASGKMLWFNAAKGFGLICTEEDERLHVAERGFDGGGSHSGRCAGREVIFDVVVHKGERQATNVRFCPEAASRRARGRQGSRPR